MPKVYSHGGEIGPAGQNGFCRVSNVVCSYTAALNFHSFPLREFRSLCDECADFSSDEAARRSCTKVLRAAANEV